MLAELAIANAAFAVIKETVSNGGDIFAAGQSLFKYFDSKSAIQRKVNEGGKNALEEFAALEQLKTQEAELKRMMVYHGRAGLWDDWLKFQAEAARKREADKREAAMLKLKKAERMATIFWNSCLIIALAFSIYFAAVVYSLFRDRL
jgi:hypothetical protein